MRCFCEAKVLFTALYRNGRRIAAVVRRGPGQQDSDKDQFLLLPLLLFIVFIFILLLLLKVVGL